MKTHVRPEVRRVLIYRMGSLGDTVVALPALHLIARAFPNAERRMLTNFPVSAKAPAAAAILEDNGLVHGYFRYGVGTRSPKELLKLWWTLLRWRPQVLVYLVAAPWSCGSSAGCEVFSVVRDFDADRGAADRGDAGECVSAGA